jgi:hypothetical protein
MAGLEGIDAYLDQLSEDIARHTQTVVYGDPRDGLIALHGVIVDMYATIGLLRDELATLRNQPAKNSSTAGEPN